MSGSDWTPWPTLRRIAGLDEGDLPMQPPRDDQRLAVELDARDLYPALRAVAPHVDRQDDTRGLDHVRLTLVTPPSHRSYLLCSATNRYTMAHAMIPVRQIAADSAQRGAAMLTPQQVKDLITDAKNRSAKPAKRSPGWDAMHGPIFTLVTETSDAPYPPVFRLADEYLTDRNPDSCPPVVLDAKLLDLFVQAATAYRSPLVLRPGITAHHAIVITVTDRFLGLLMPMRPEPSHYYLDDDPEDWDLLLRAAQRGGGAQ